MEKKNIREEFENKVAETIQGAWVGYLNEQQAADKLGQVIDQFLEAIAAEVEHEVSIHSRLDIVDAQHNAYRVAAAIIRSHKGASSL